jgi:hypothetical protein
MRLFPDPMISAMSVGSPVQGLTPQFQQQLQQQQYQQQLQQQQYQQQQLQQFQQQLQSQIQLMPTQRQIQSSAIPGTPTGSSNILQAQGLQLSQNQLILSHSNLLMDFCTQMSQQLGVMGEFGRPIL